MHKFADAMGIGEEDYCDELGGDLSDWTTATLLYTLYSKRRIAEFI